LLFAFGGAATLSASDIYRWTDKDGVIHFSDSPPEVANNVSDVDKTTGYDYDPKKDVPHQNFPEQSKKGASATDSTAPIRGKKKLPKVELFSTSWCGYCTKARNYFQANNIPFSEYDIEKDKTAARRYKQMTTRRGVPFVLIGNRKIQGFNPAAYAAALKVP
jgi:glutaredoxin